MFLIYQIINTIYLWVNKYFIEVKKILKIISKKRLRKTDIINIFKIYPSWKRSKPNSPLGLQSLNTVHTLIKPLQNLNPHIRNQNQARKKSSLSLSLPLTHTNTHAHTYSTEPTRQKPKLKFPKTKSLWWSSTHRRFWCQHGQEKLQLLWFQRSSSSSK